MTQNNAKWRVLAAALAASASLAACNDDNGNQSAPTPASTSFTAFTMSTFAADANSTPVSLDGVTFVFDADDNPTAFDTMVMAGTY
jgi:ABC-type glycerol-3-phosphate transport system substrate-binding protein